MDRRILRRESRNDVGPSEIYKKFWRVGLPEPNKKYFTEVLKHVVDGSNGVYRRTEILAARPLLEELLHQWEVELEVIKAVESGKVRMAPMPRGAVR